MTTRLADRHSSETDVSRIETAETRAHGRRSLFVLDPVVPSTVLRAALRDSRVSDGEIHLLAVFPPAEYQARRRARIDANLTATYTVDSLEEEARRIARQAGREWLGPTGVEFESMGAVGRLRDTVRRAVEDRGCTHVYVVIPRRTLWQRLLGTQDLSTTLARILPTDVIVVSVDDTFDPVLDLPDPSSVADVAALPGEPSVK